ncbi:MAG: single-stranded-DNA-specific exonuclease RecJ [Thermomicrobiales bacterium]
MIDVTDAFNALRSQQPIAWIEPAPIPNTGALQSLHPNPVVAEILWRRGHTNPEAASTFTDTRPRPAPSPWRIPNMEAAVERVTSAIRTGEKVAIFGDYDADGVTSAALLTRLLQPHLDEERVLTLLPERSEGYGLSLRGVGDATRFDASLLITVDCGSSDHKTIGAAHQAGLDVIVLDHHRINGEPPEHAIVVSTQLGDDLAMRDLTGVGIAWLLACGLAQNGIQVADPPAKTERAFLDLVAIGTVADVSALDGINRDLVRDGVEILRKTIRPGLRAMARVAERELGTLTATDIAFMIAPRLNAAGRIGSPRVAYDLLMERDPAFAERHALELERINRQRKHLAATMQDEAAAQIIERPDWDGWPVLIASSPGWPAGMVGMVASKIVEASGCPTILFEEREDGVLVGSARAIEGVNIGAMLDELGGLLIRHGGHSGAAGLSLHRDRLEEFSESLADLMMAVDVEIPEPPSLDIAADLAPESVSVDTVRALKCLEPLGQGNETPLFRINGARLLQYSTMGASNDHLRVTIRHGDRQLECVFWNAAHRSGELTERRSLDLVGTLGINTWRDSSRLQFELKDFRMGS